MRLRLLRIALLLLVRLPIGPPVPVRVQRAWLSLFALTNPPRRRLPHQRLQLSGVPVEQIDGAGDTDARGAILYLHGGGYVAGSPRIYRPLTSSLAAAARAVVYAVDYRLAPEHPFPAARDDVIACYRSLLARGHEPGRIALAGDSAGGGVCMSVALALRERRLPAPAALALLSPWIDLSLSGESVKVNARREVVLRRSWLECSAVMYRGDRQAADPECSPLFADLAGLPPTMIQTATHDLLLSDSERLAERAGDAGVTVELDLRDGLCHIFQLFPRSLPEADAALADLGAFIRRRMDGEKPST